MGCRKLWFLLGSALGSSGCLGASPELTSESEAGPPLCGGKDCLGGACLEDVCQPILVAPFVEGFQPTAVAVDPAPAGSLFCTTYLGNSVVRVEKDGSKLTTIANFPADRHTIEVTIDSDRLYVTMFNLNVLTPVAAIDRDGKNPISLGKKTFHGPWSVVFDDDYVYWTNRYDNDEIIRAPKGGGSYEVLLHEDKTHIEEEELYGLALDGNDLYFALYKSPLGYIGKMSKSGGPVSEVVAGLPAAVAVDATHVYWSENQAIRRFKKDGSEGMEVISEKDSGGGLAVDDGYVYWPHFGIPPNPNGDIRRWKIATHGPVETLATEQVGPSGLAFDATAIYWTNQGGGVMKLAK